MAVKKLDIETQRTVALLSAHGKSTNKISKLTGLHHTSIKNILLQDNITNLKGDIEARLADKFEQLTEAILDSISEGDLLKASLQQKSISAACLLDKSRLIKNRSTQNLAVMCAAAVVEAARQQNQAYLDEKIDEVEGD